VEGAEAVEAVVVSTVEVVAASVVVDVVVPAAAVGSVVGVVPRVSGMSGCPPQGSLGSSVRTTRTELG
jgi:hypothetical protein